MAAEEPTLEEDRPGGAPGLEGWHLREVGRNRGEGGPGRCLWVTCNSDRSRGGAGIICAFARSKIPPPPPSNLSSLRKERKKHQHLARRWGGKSEGERGEEGKQRKGGRERKGAFTNTTKLQIWLPRLSPHHCKEMKTHFKLEPFPTPLQPLPHALSLGASAHIYQKLNRTREAQNLLCVRERERTQGGRRGRGAEGGEFIYKI